MTKDDHSSPARPQFSLLMLIWTTAWLGVVVNLFWHMRMEYALLFSVPATAAMFDGFLLCKRSVTRWRIRRLVIATVSIGITLAIIFSDSDQWARETVFQPFYNRQAQRIAGDLSRHVQGNSDLSHVKVSVVNFKGHHTISVTGSVPDSERFNEFEQVVAQAVPPGRLAWGVVAEDAQ